MCACVCACVCARVKLIDQTARRDQGASATVLSGLSRVPGTEPGSPAEWSEVEVEVRSGGLHRIVVGSGERTRTRGVRVGVRYE